MKRLKQAGFPIQFAFFCAIWVATLAIIDFVTH
jgi:hypothetical protein